jgi:hypothetical protein
VAVQSQGLLERGDQRLPLLALGGGAVGEGLAGDHAEPAGDLLAAGRGEQPAALGVDACVDKERQKRATATKVGTGQLAAAMRPARTRLTSTNHPVSARGGPSRRGRSRCGPGHTGQHLLPSLRPQPGTSPETGHQHNQ